MDSKRDVFHLTALSGWKLEENKAPHYLHNRNLSVVILSSTITDIQKMSPQLPFLSLSGIKQLLRMIYKQKSLASAQTACKKTFTALTVLNFVQNCKLVFRTLLSYELCLGWYFWLMAEYWVIRKNRKNSFILSVKSIHRRHARTTQSKEYSSKIFSNSLR